MREYHAGPMSTIPQFNIPLFDRVAADRRAQGNDVVSPAELDDPVTHQAELDSPDGSLVELAKVIPGRGTFGDFLARDVKLIADEGIEQIIVLPGWHKSKGARLETFVARLCGLSCYRYRGRRPLRKVSTIRLVIAWVLGR